MIKGKGKLAETQSGMDWLSNCLHPPTGRTPNRPVKDQPDLSAQASVCLHYPIINEQPINPMSLDPTPVVKYSKYLYIMTNSPLYDFVVLRITPQGTPELKIGEVTPSFMRLVLLVIPTSAWKPWLITWNHIDSSAAQSLLLRTLWPSTTTLCFMVRKFALTSAFTPLL